MSEPMIYGQRDYRRIGLALSYRLASWQWWSLKARERMRDAFEADYPQWPTMTDDELLEAATAFVAAHCTTVDGQPANDCQPNWTDQA